MDLLSSETKLIGQWTTVGNTVEADNVSKRIDELVETKLKEVVSSEGGWKTLYVDPRDGRHWELSYPHQALHGGGPPAIKYIPEEQARKEYEVIDNAG